MRVIAGYLRGQRLQTPAGHHTRPSTSRAREAVFDILSHAQWTPDWQDTHVLDLFAGAGTMGIEALSRGAADCICLDNNAQARQAIAANVDALNLGDRLRILARNALNPGRPCAHSSPCNLLFLDPPYSANLVSPALKAITQHGWLAPKALAVIECAAKSPPILPEPWQTHTIRDYGHTRFIFAHGPDTV